MVFKAQHLNIIQFYKEDMMQTVINKFKRVLKNWLFSKEMADIKNMQIIFEFATLETEINLIK